MIPCPQCARHIRIDADACPFCGATHGGTIAAAALALVLVVAACGPTTDGIDGGTTTTTTGTATTTSSSSSSPSTTAVDTSAGTSGPVTSTTFTTDGVTSSSTNDDSDDAPCAFYGCACCDFGEPPVFECDLWAQDCPVGEKCTPWSPQRTWEGHCVPVDPAPAAAGEPCTIVGRPTDFLDDCEAGAWCYGVDFVASTGVCVALCTGGPANPLCNTGACTDHDDDGVVKLCLPSCDAAAPDCADDLTCTAGAALDGSDVCVAG